MPPITFDRANELLECDFKTGVLTWKTSRRGAAKGAVVGTQNKAGYLITLVDGHRLYNHRLVWLLYHGYLPENVVDHINRDKSDNRISNLREVSYSCNRINTALPKNNTSGIKGVYSNRHGGWTAKITANNKSYTLGHYKSKDNAICARLAGEQCLGLSACEESPAYHYVKRHIQNKQRPVETQLDLFEEAV